MKKIGIVGNRNGWTKKEVFKILEEYGFIGENINIITGGAEGVDSYAMEYAKNKGCVLTVYYPDKIAYLSPVCYYKRNKRIAWNCDILIAFNRKKYSGTLITINFAKDFNKEVIIKE